MALAILGLATLIRLASNSEISLLGLKDMCHHAQPTQPFFRIGLFLLLFRFFIFFLGGVSLYILYVSPVPHA